MAVSEHRVELGDVDFSYVQYGADDGPLVLCLHGFPDTPYSFRYLGPHLAAKGYRVITPSTRGFAPSSISASGDYGLRALANDANEFHEHLGADERAVLIGHDWGAAAAYMASDDEPERWRRVITMAVPPLAVMAQSFLTYDQLRASWYMFFFQSPMPESAVSMNDFAFLAELWRAWSPSFDPSTDLRAVRDALDTPENLSAALGYYRAMFAPRAPEAIAEHPRRSAPRVASVPTLYLHGDEDGCFLSAGLSHVLDSLAPGSKFELIESAGHFVHLERPDAVHAAIDSFLEI
jgi:pimeloyl-ACP methyl ester carboxylesterase